MTDTAAVQTFDPQAFDAQAPDARALAALGEGQIAYVKPIRSDDVRRIFPQAPELAPGLDLFALLSASGAPILLTDSRETALANAWAHDLTTVSLN